MSLPTIQAIETGGDFRASTADKIMQAFADHDIEITNGDNPGARMTLPYDRSELKEMFEAVVEALSRSEEPDGDARRVLRLVETHPRVMNDILPGALSRAIKELTEDDRGPSTYREAAPMVRGLLPPQ